MLSEIKLFPNETLSILFRNKSRHIFFNCKIFFYFFSKKMYFPFIELYFPHKKHNKESNKTNYFFPKTS